MQGNSVELIRRLIRWQEIDPDSDPVEMTEQAVYEEERDAIIARLQERGADYTIEELDVTDLLWIEGIQFASYDEAVAAVGMGEDAYRAKQAADEAARPENIAKRALAEASAGSLMFVLEAQSDNSRLDDITIIEHADLFAEWTEPGVQCKRGTILRDGGKLYQALHDINDVAQAAHRPSETPTLWAVKGDPGEEWPSWSQWMGVGDLYMTGDKCSSVDCSTPADETIYHWVSTADNNVWRPGEHGWELVTT